jgi:hypothetical protein
VKLGLSYYGEVRLMMKIFGPKKKEVTGVFRKIPKRPLERRRWEDSVNILLGRELDYAGSRKAQVGVL